MQLNRNKDISRKAAKAQKKRIIRLATENTEDKKSVIPAQAGIQRQSKYHREFCYTGLNWVNIIISLDPPDVLDSRLRGNDGRDSLGLEHFLFSVPSVAEIYCFLCAFARDVRCFKHPTTCARD